MECTNWVTDDQNNILLRYNPPPNYPGIKEHQLESLQITYGTLIEAISTTKKNLGMAHGIKLLQGHGLNKEAIDRILSVPMH